MSKGVFINFLRVDRQPKQVIISLFEALKIANHETLDKNMTKLFDQYGLRRKIIYFVKDERSNLNTMTITLKSIVRCEILSLDKRFKGTCFDHVLRKNVNTL
jgi:hypothetical protein